MIRAYAEPKNGRKLGPAGNVTADDKAYTAWATGAAAEAGVKNPVKYVNNNIRTSVSPANRNKVTGSINRRKRK